MQTEITLFENVQFGKVRTVLHNNEPYFVGKDVAEALGYNDTDYAVRTHCKGPKSYAEDSSGQVRYIKIIPERDVYRLVMRSKKPEAERFEEWVVAEVLPSIRKTGKYDIEHSIPKTYAEALQLAANQAKQIEEQHAQLKEQEPLVKFANHVAESSDAISVREFAKLAYSENITLGQNKLFKWLRDKGYLMKNNEPYQRWIDAGYFTVIEQTFTTSYGKRVSNKTLVTGKGQIKLLETLKEEFNA